MLLALLACATPDATPPASLLAPPAGTGALAVGSASPPSVPASGLVLGGWAVEPDDAGARLGAAVAVVGDVDGDGVADVLIGAPGAGGGAGTAGLYLGGAAGPSSTAAWTYTGSAGASVGAAVAGLGDVDGDGYADFAVGAPGDASGATGGGAVHVFHGGPAGPSASPDWSYACPRPRCAVGGHLAWTGDVDHDGYDDLALASPGWTQGAAGEGRVTVYRGAATGLGASPSFVFVGGQAGAGLSVAVGLGDVDGDGYDDLGIGAGGYDGSAGADAGRVWVFRGGGAGVRGVPWARLDGNTAGARLGGDLAGLGDVDADGYADLGLAGGVYGGGAAGVAAGPSWTAPPDPSAGPGPAGVLAPAGDLDGDGVADVLVLAPATGAGAVRVFAGGAGGPGDIPARWLRGVDTGDAFGTAAAVGDLDGDGAADVVVGAPARSEPETDEGAASWFRGTSDPGFGPGWAWYGEGAATNAAFGYSVAFVPDVDGDGDDELVVASHLVTTPEGGSRSGRVAAWWGEPGGPSAREGWSYASDREHAYFGVSVRGLGDLDGDGAGELAVGGPEAGDAASGYGYLDVWYGRSGGFAPTPDVELLAEPGEDEVGRSFDGAGDVDGDGFGDLVLYSVQSGRTVLELYRGSGAGLATTPSWSGDVGPHRSELGRAAGGGDVDGDGLGDVVIGDPYFEDGIHYQGRVLLYTSDGSGFGAGPAWSVEGDQDQVRVGLYGLADDGDVNGDGYDDIAVGVPYQRVAFQAYAGEAWVYFGGPGTPAATPDWRYSTRTADDWVGNTLAYVPDLDGDGTDELAVAGWDYGASTGADAVGAVWMFLGGAAGPSAAPSWTRTSATREEQAFGTRLAVGDADGDGVSDLAVGAYTSDTPTAEYAGRAYLFLGY